MTLQIILVFTLTCPKTFTRGHHVSVFDKYLHWPCVRVFFKKTLQPNRCKCKKIGHVSVNDLHLHGMYMPYIRRYQHLHTQHWFKQENSKSRELISFIELPL